MKVTRHNGRSGKNGVYNPKHNDRKFDIEKAEHIDAERTVENITWDYRNGYNTNRLREMSGDFSEVEAEYYDMQYSDYVRGQNRRNEENRHPERNRTTYDIYKNKKTAPEESLLQIGDMAEHVDPETLKGICEIFFRTLEARYGEHFHILDWALHLDEATPHVHERHVFDCENAYGELYPQQEKALELLGFERPHPDQKPGKNNNRKISFDNECRKLFLDICEEYRLEVDRDPMYGGRKYLEKQEYIVQKLRGEISQNEAVITKQISEMDELDQKLQDLEDLLDEVADIAYDKAVEAVTDNVVVQTQKKDIELVEGSKQWVLSPERKAPKKEREYAAARLDGVISKIRKSMEGTIDKIREIFKRPETKKVVVEQIKEKARPSIRARLEEKKNIVKERESSRGLDQHSPSGRGSI